MEDIVKGHDRNGHVRFISCLWYVGLDIPLCHNSCKG